MIQATNFYQKKILNLPIFLKILFYRVLSKEYLKKQEKFILFSEAHKNVEVVRVAPRKKSWYYLYIWVNSYLSMTFYSTKTMSLGKKNPSGRYR